MPTRERLRTLGLRTGTDQMRAAGREVRHLRRTAGLTQAELAAPAGVSRQFICRWSSAGCVTWTSPAWR